MRRRGLFAALAGLGRLSRVAPTEAATMALGADGAAVEAASAADLAAINAAGAALQAEIRALGLVLDRVSRA